jgi:predicted nucleic acid-binding Zn ribbon protein
MSGLPAPDHCAICGAAIPPKARACPECGADERTGWREQSVYDGLDLPGEDAKGPARDDRSMSIWKIAGIVLLVVVAIMVLFNRL